MSALNTAAVVHRADNLLVRQREAVASSRRIHTAGAAHRQAGCRAGREAAGEEPASRAVGCSHLVLEPEGIQLAEHCILQAGQAQAAAGYIHRTIPVGVVDRLHVRLLSRPWCRTRSR